MSDLILSSDELTSLRADAAEYLPVTASIYRRTSTSDSMGGFTVTEALQATAYCRVDAPSRKVLEQYAELIGTRSAYLLNFEAATDVAVGDKVTISTTNYEVIGTLSGGSWEITRQMLGVIHE